MDLLDRAQKGDKEALGELVRAELAKVYNLALRLCRNKDDASDLCQDTFVKAIRNIHNFRKDADIWTWLYRITVNTWKNRVRSEKRRHFSSHVSLSAGSNDSEEPKEWDLPDSEPRPDEEFERNETVRDLYKSLDQLAPEEKTIIVLKDVEDLPYEEIARIMELNIGTVKSRLSRARNHLREIHLKRGGKVA